MPPPRAAPALLAYRTGYVKSSLAVDTSHSHKIKTNTEFVGHKQNTTSHEARKTGHTLINVKSTCGAIGATSKCLLYHITCASDPRPIAELITAVSGPNGNLEWLNCGMNAAGWTVSLAKSYQSILFTATDFAPVATTHDCERHRPHGLGDCSPGP